MALNDVEHCEACQIHEDVVKAVTDHMPDEDQLYDLAEVFKVFGDSTRIKILYVLFEAELCVCDIAQLLNMTQSAISHQLRILKQNRLVKNRRDGKSVFYSLADEYWDAFQNVRAKYNILADDIPMKYFIDSFNVCLDMYGILSFDPVYFPSVSELMASIKISGYGESDDE